MNIQKLKFVLGNKVINYFVIFLVAHFVVGCGGGGSSKSNIIENSNASISFGAVNSASSFKNSSIAATSNSSAISSLSVSILIETDKTVVNPLEAVRVYPKNFELDAKNSIIQIDFSGTSRFLAEDIINLPVIIKDKVVVFRAPVLKMLDHSNYKNVGGFSLRIIQDERKYSNTITFKENQSQLASYDAKLNVLAYDLIIKAMLIKSSNLSLISQGEQFKPGKIYYLNNDLVGNADVAGEISTAYLTQVLGARFIDNPIGSSLKNNSHADKSKLEKFNLIPDTEGVWAPVFSCLRSGIDAASSDIANSYDGDGCFETAKQSVGEWIGSMGDVHTDFVTAVEALFPASGFALAHFSGDTVSTMTVASQLTYQMANWGQLAISGDSGKFLNRTVTNITAIGIGEVVQNINKNIYQVNQLGKILFGSDGIQAVSLITGDKLQKLYELESHMYASSGSTFDSILSQDDKSESTYTESNGLFTFVFNSKTGALIDTVVDQTLVVLSDFTGYDTFEAASGSCAPLPQKSINLIKPKGSRESCYFASGLPNIDKPDCSPVKQVTLMSPSECLSLRSAFASSKFSESINDLTEAHHLAVLSLCYAPWFSDWEGCNHIFENLALLTQRIIDAAQLYNSGGKTLNCDKGYQSFKNQSITTCVYQELVATEGCPPGSRVTGWPSVQSCVYYSRDFIQDGGGCRFNYSLVDFIGKNRCRWSGLSVDRPAAYVINSVDGSQRILER